ncbi:battenin [Belonocnema kinseyi]|uniref:battenin n=1 Tax=Belonocnema kinseyi TaxID=2817044 RepID=UPI00143D7653|nr:battenin [Belonocnema kinseyi]
MAKGVVTVTEEKQRIDEEDRLKKTARWRDLLAFWLLGLCNNYGYVVMLSAAHDILTKGFSEDQADQNFDENVHNNTSGEHIRICNPISTGAILLADILPCLAVKLVFPFIPFYVHARVASCILFSAAGLLLVALGNSSLLLILGVVLTSISSGVGETTLLSYSNRFNKHVISTWSSGTGGAGIFGAISYAGLKIWLSTRDTLLLMLIVPVLEAIAFWFILVHPTQPMMPFRSEIGSQEQMIKVPEQTFSEKMKLLPTLMKFMIPLGLVYFFEYFINQGLLELIQFEKIWLPHDAQYRWLQVDYQIGVFISRSSAVFFTIDKIWIMSVLQFINVIILLCETLFYYVPNIWIIFALVLWEGLLGGGAYVNTFYRMVKELPSGDREASMGIASLADSIGIALAGWAAMPVHNVICKLPPPIRS